MAPFARATLVRATAGIGRSARYRRRSQAAGGPDDRDRSARIPVRHVGKAWDAGRIWKGERGGLPVEDMVVLGVAGGREEKPSTLGGAITACRKARGRRRGEADFLRIGKSRFAVTFDAPLGVEFA